MRAQSAPPILLRARCGALVGAVLRHLMHLVHRHQHAIGAGVLEVEVVAGRAEDRLGAQTEVLADAVHGMHDVIADPQIGQRDRDAFLDRAQLDAFGGLAEDLAIAQHAQTQSGNREAGFDRAGVDVDGAAAPSATPSVPKVRPRADARSCALRSTRSRPRAASRPNATRRWRPARPSRRPRPTPRPRPTNISMRRLKCSAGRVSSTNPCALGGSQATSPGFDAAGDDQHAMRRERCGEIRQSRKRRGAAARKYRQRAGHQRTRRGVRR